MWGRGGRGGTAAFTYLLRERHWQVLTEDRATCETLWVRWRVPAGDGAARTEEATGPTAEHRHPASLLSGCATA